VKLGISRRDRRTLFVGASVIAPLLALTRGLPTWLAWSHEITLSAFEMAAEAERAEASARALPALQDSLARRGERFVELGSVVVPGETPAVAAGSLAGIVADLAARANVELGPLSLKVDSMDTALLTRVSASGSLTGDIRGVSEWLNALERGPKLLAVRTLSISQAEPAAPADRPESLRVEFVIEALAFPGEVR
jgi:hypothetical protein